MLGIVSGQAVSSVPWIIVSGAAATAAASAPSGVSKKAKRRHFVEIDDQRFEVRSEAEALQLIESLKEAPPNREQKRAIRTAFVNQPKDNFGDVSIPLKLKKVLIQRRIEKQRNEDDDEVILLLLH